MPKAGSNHTYLQALIIRLIVFIKKVKIIIRKCFLRNANTLKKKLLGILLRI